MIIESIRKVVRGNDLSDSEMENTMMEIIDGKATPSQVGSFVAALRVKGETVDEITGAARALRSRSQKLGLNNNVLNIDRDEINVEGETILETSETGRSGTATFNVSTATIFVVAGGGVRVARHGSRTASAWFGAPDVLENLGISPEISSSDVERCILEVGIGFFFTPLFQGPMRYVARLREEMGIRTIFNLIGPLTNPANASSHVLGVYRQSLTGKLARVLKNLGASDAFVVCGEETYDEISICGPTKISRLIDGEIQTRVIEPEEYGIKRADREAIRGGDARKNAEIITKILDGEIGPPRDIVVLNAAAAFVASRLDSNLKDGITRANEVIDSGKARKKLDALAEFTEKCAPFVRKEL